MRIIIPTYRRVNAQLTFWDLPQCWRARTTFVVDERDAKSLRFRWPRLEGNGTRIEVVPGCVETIAQKRAWILETTPHERIVMMDDDLRFAVRKETFGGDDVGLVKAGHQEIDHFLCLLNEKLHEVPHAGFSARQGNNRLPPGWRGPARMMYVLGYHVPTVRKHCELGRIETREDFDYALQLLRAGFNNAVTSSICVDQKYNAAGGASTERSVERSNADADRLAELHPGLVKVVEKPYKTSLPRREVVVQWKKAFEDSKRAPFVGG